MRRPIPSLWWEDRTASKFRWACSSPKYMMAKATTRSRSQASSVNVSLFAIERATRSGPQDQPRPVSIRSRDIAAIFAASAGRPGLSVMFFAFMSGKSNATSMQSLADCRKRGHPGRAAVPPRGAAGRSAVRLERLHHGQNDRGGQKTCRHLVKPAVPEVRPRISVARKIGKQLAAVQMIGDQQDDDPELGVEPGTREAVAEPQPSAEGEGQQRARRHDAPVELALHDLEPLPARRVLGQGVVDEQTRQVEQPGEPSHHENDMQRLDPEHRYLSNRLRKRTVAA